mgnify:FL=1
MNSETGNVRANYKKVQDIVSKELPADADFLILPEVWTVGWSCKDFPAAAEYLENSKTI